MKTESCSGFIGCFIGWATQRNKGITLVELLVAISLSGLVFALLGGLYIFVNKIMIGFQGRSFLNEQRILFDAELREQLQPLAFVAKADENAMDVVRIDGSRCSLEFVDSKNLRVNGRVLLPVGIDLADFRIDYYSIDEREDGRQFQEVVDWDGNFEIDGKELSLIEAVEISYTLLHKNMRTESFLLFSRRASNMEVGNETI